MFSVKINVLLKEASTSKDTFFMFILTLFNCQIKEISQIPFLYTVHVSSHKCLKFNVICYSTAKTFIRSGIREIFIIFILRKQGSRNIFLNTLSVCVALLVTSLQICLAHQLSFSHQQLFVQEIFKACQAGSHKHCY